MKRTISFFISIVVMVTLCSCSYDKELPKEEQIKAICELATLKCYYNNVAKNEKKKGTGIKHTFEKDREMWIEYEGFAEIGVDMERVTMRIDDESVVVSMPNAELLDIGIVAATLNEKSYIISEDGFLNKNKISTEEQNKAISKAQKEMTEAVKENKVLFQQAEKEAKNLIESYINKVGEASEIKYTIKWKKA